MYTSTPKQTKYKNKKLNHIWISKVFLLPSKLFNYMIFLSYIFISLHIRSFSLKKMKK